MKSRIPLLTLLLSAALAADATAQAITGRVVSSTGAGVPGVNIDGFDTDGNEIDLANDGTDVNGNFTTTVLSGPGVYRFVFYPPAPPQTTHLVGERDNVVVVTTTNLGTITLEAGVLLTGRAVRAGSIPVANVALVVIDGPSGVPVEQVQTKTNAFGQFNLAIPQHECELRLDATSQAIVLGSRFFELDPTGTVALGDILLPPGALVTGHVQRSSGLAVAGVDLDFDKVASGNGVYVPDDNTDNLGNFSVVVALNTYDISLCPNPASLLASQLLAGQTISTTTNLGTITLADGKRLFGTVLDSHGAPAGQVDVDVFVHATGAPVPLCNDNTSASGAYSVFVPAGTYDVVFTPAAAGSAIGGDWHRNVVVSADTQLDGMLPARGHGNSFTDPLPFAGGILVPIAPGARGPRTRAGLPPGSGTGTGLVLSLADGDLVVDGGNPGARLLLLVGSEFGPQTGLLLPPGGADGRTRWPIDRLPTRTWLRVVSPDGRSASALHRLQR
jgi:hypothetical protein